MKGIAYSYLRFSTAEQAMGDSRRRQTALAETYAREHDLLLDKGLNFRDLGVSAYRGKNAKQGGLRSFLDAVEHGLVPANSYLLVESLDRLSRDEILEAQALFLQIVTAGVTIITLVDKRSYSVASLNANPTDLIISLVYIMRANEESSTKSMRLRAAWAARRDAPGSCYHGLQCPSWLTGKADRSGYEVIPDKAAIVQRIYREALAGDGLQQITRRLNADGIPMFGRGNQKGKIRQRALIRHILMTNLVIGTYTPCQAEEVNGKQRYVPLAPKPNYYPAIITAEDWQTIRARRLAWSEHYGCGRRTTTVANVIARLARCPRCDRPMVLQRTNIPNQRYLICMAWRESRTCSDKWVRFPEVEAVFINDVRHLIKHCPRHRLHVEARRAMLKSVSNRLSHLRTRLASEDAAHDTLATVGRAGRNWAVASRGEMERLLAERYQLRADRNYWSDATLKLKLESLQAAVSADPRDIARINLALRSLLSKVVIDWENDRLVLHWRHGGETFTNFYSRRQRGGVRNPTPIGDR
jgi:DNA invertase Pin-like site-specific DNA recombinase